MAVLNGEGGLRAGPLKTFTIALATPRETLLGSPVALPTTEPATSQISFTLSASDFPTMSPVPISTRYSAILYAAGKNTDAASQTVNWRILKNGSSVATGSQTGIATNVFWTQMYNQAQVIQIGDVLEIRLWSTSANVNYDYFAVVVHPSRMNLGNALINKDVTYTTILHTLSSGTPLIDFQRQFSIYPTNTLNNYPINVITATTLTFGALKWDSTYYSGQIFIGDNMGPSTNAVTHVTKRPYYQQNTIPSQISFRELR